MTDAKAVIWTQETGSEISVPFAPTDFEETTLGEPSDYFPAPKFNLFDEPDPTNVEETLGVRSGYSQLANWYSPRSFVGNSVTQLAWKEIEKTRNQEMANEARRILLLIKKVSHELQSRGISFDDVPSLYAHNVEDDSLLIEWIFDDFRIGFSIEPELSESSWYLVTKANLGQINAGGYIGMINLELLIWGLLFFVRTRSPEIWALFSSLISYANEA